ncbi:hypothetical protein AWB75_05476 [Caballeronia catudaia]|uniref:Uncharacterized protein n=1 Tax=Caballeronia catudaia TaxID=1777136 RepID=A0A158CNP7_9BURK|nr:hypothetical protein AWB75_05476 [Caballeronia catudaia]
MKICFATLPRDVADPVAIDRPSNACAEVEQ